MASKCTWKDPNQSDRHELSLLEFDTPDLSGGATLAGHPIDVGHVLVLARGDKRALGRVVSDAAERRCGGLALQVLEPHELVDDLEGDLIVPLADLGVVQLRWPSGDEVRSLLSAQTARLV